MHCFYTLNAAERQAMSEVTNLSLNDLHIIEAVYDSLSTSSNNFTTIANKLGVTLGTLSTSFKKLEAAGYLKREKYLVDQRVYYIKPTKKAEAIHKFHMKWHQDIIDQSTDPTRYEDFINIFKGFSNTFTNILTKPKE